MIDVGAMVADLIEAGCAPEVAAVVVTRAFVAGVSSAEFRGAPVDKTAEKRRAYDRERKRKSTGNPPESSEAPVSPIDTIIKEDKRQNSDRPSRGTRIDPNWSPSEADRLLAKQEGFAESEIEREALRFRDYWTGRAGSGGVKLDWSATWRNWIRTSGEKLGKTPNGSGSAASETGFYVRFGSEEQDAWDRYGYEKRGKSFPRDKAGGWRHPSRWPPGYIAPDKPHGPGLSPPLRSMQ